MDCCRRALSHPPVLEFPTICWVRILEDITQLHLYQLMGGFSAGDPIWLSVSERDSRQSAVISDAVEASENPVQSSVIQQYGIYIHIQIQCYY